MQPSSAGSGWRRRQRRQPPTSYSSRTLRNEAAGSPMRSQMPEATAMKPVAPPPMSKSLNLRLLLPAFKTITLLRAAILVG